MRGPAVRSSWESSTHGRPKGRLLGGRRGRRGGGAGDPAAAARVLPVRVRDAARAAVTRDRESQTARVDLQLRGVGADGGGGDQGGRGEDGGGDQLLHGGLLGVFSPFESAIQTIFPTGEISVAIRTSLLKCTNGHRDT